MPSTSSGASNFLFEIGLHVGLKVSLRGCFDIGTGQVAVPERVFELEISPELSNRQRVHGKHQGSPGEKIWPFPTWRKPDRFSG